YNSIMKHKLLPLFSVYLDVVIFGCNQVEVETSQIEDEVNFTIDLPVESKAAIYDFLSTITNDIKDASTRSADKIYPIRGFFEPL
ncbi:MAG: hypothetical protein LIP08_11775, partial [Bacteroides sp.]|nr:hypothetical protein [Bacteroides sp.]